MRVADPIEKFATLVERFVPHHGHHGLVSVPGLLRDAAVCMCRCGILLQVCRPLYDEAQVWIGLPPVCPICGRDTPHLHLQDPDSAR